MGMFDYVQCDYPLPPDGRVVDGAVWQSKDGPCDMGLIVITADGRVRFEQAHYEDVPEEQRPFFGTPEWEDPICRLCGSIRRVVDSHTGGNYTGTVNFYRSVPLSDKEWEEYAAVFVDGKIVAVREQPETADAVDPVDGIAAGGPRAKESV